MERLTVARVVTGSLARWLTGSLARARFGERWSNFGDGLGMVVENRPVRRRSSENRSADGAIDDRA
ncbi:hypothetical protein BS329_14630 [Amycolatopsis coloradensis]|uniref:Uncharacterized protein n=1 Tax=Amycolatopsis coloradensis TaxID=76021 RepID=A0A1R0KV69_9PSEU|nr:hypothetical protein [Amycolatopsis coloradensis]OLZ52535.1 hypothetical protein BS329_14630 [Amycolatopsis coloradensis]